MATPSPLSPQDHLDITELIHRLCHALDFGRPEEFVACFVADGRYSAVSSEATGLETRFSHRGRGELEAFAQSAIEKRHGLGRHWTGNLIVRPSGPTRDRAEATSYVLFVEIDPESGERRIAISGTHRDELVRTPDGWRLRSRTVVADL
ncbi:MAG: nuclear transport factor 2 family protein [Nocardioides sp.]|uniref:nuclear transport factor 2 family protein n=1 Tax=Nocardioides sp. TaxID=35761 RepID=UPI0039E60589